MPTTFLAVSTRKGLWFLESRDKKAWKHSRSAPLRGHRAPHGDGPARRKDDPRGDAYRSPRARGVPLARIAGRRGRRHRRGRRSRRASPAAAPVDHVFWLTPGPSDAARRLVRGHVAARDLPAARTAGTVGRPSTDSTTIRSSRSGWAAIRTSHRTAAKTHSILVESAQPRSHVRRTVRRRLLRVAGRGA
jgi:hypothetical protein